MLVLNETEIVALIKKRIKAIFPMNVEEEVVETKLATKYSVVLIDSKLCFWEQIHWLQTGLQIGLLSYADLWPMLVDPNK